MRTRPEHEPGGRKRVAVALDAVGSAPWWARTGALVAVAVLLVLTALPPWSGPLVGPGEGIPGWAAVTALAAAGLLAGGLGLRWTLHAAAAAATLTAVLASVAYLRTPDAADAPSWLSALAYPAERPAAALTLALVAAAAAAVCLALAARPGAWLPAEGGRRARGRRLLAVGTAAALVGGLLGAGAVAGVDRAQRAVAGGPYYDAVSDPLDPWLRYGYEVTLGEHQERLPHLEPTGVGWQGSLPGPAELTTCLLGQPSLGEDGSTAHGQRIAGSTLVTVEQQDGADAVIGVDPANGMERWRYTVRHGQVAVPAEGGGRGGRVAVHLGHVAVSPLCAVHVVIEPLTLVTLDGSSGKVLQETPLPGGGPGWTFVTDAGTEPGTDGPDEEATSDRRPVVALPRTTHVYLRSPSALAEFTETGELLGYGDLPDCAVLAAPQGDPFVRGVADAVLLSQDCPGFHVDFVAVPPAPRDPSGSGAAHLLRPVVPSGADHVPVLGCEAAPRISQLLPPQQLSRLSLVGRWCDRFEGPIILQYRSDRRLVEATELPADTELPLRVVGYTGSRVAWISGGELHRVGPMSERIFHETDWPLSVLDVGRELLYAGDEAIEAALVDTAPRTVDGRRDDHELVYTVGVSGTVTALIRPDHDGPSEFTRYAELPGAAGRCTGDRDLLLDRPGQRLLVTCESEAGTEVTVIETERPPEA
ncbi:hypothetical protein [Streptomyces spiramenti]|uniref:PQQ-binding-like beta-propeller repeat protein n=1 Tax=Streptomyces spiramenti TaxID=2720606 RepID=A0ABX1ARA4_9ACTN|nr:hypothetical protein [Streptomyces spiramenti]NJP68136.1 hypothetical protein [Streptomyces spiramenti]